MKKLRGRKLLVAVINKIIADPECWNQHQWHCGSAHCIAGHAQTMAGRKASSETCYDDAREALELDVWDANFLFSPYRSFGELYEYAKTGRQELFDGYANPSTFQPLSS